MRKISGFICSLICAVCYHSSVVGEDLNIAQLSETDFFSEFPIVLTATRLKQPQKNSPIATTIIDREMIEASGFTEIADILRLAPNMIVSYDSGHIPAVGYSFLFDRYTVRMQILIDGRSVYTPIFGEMYWSNLGISVDDIERIEVIRGPSSSSYGPNAMTGVISIITKDASTDQGSKLKVTRGNNGIQENHFSNANNVGDLSYRVSLTTRKNHGLETRYDDTDLHIINLKTNYQVDNNDEIEFNIAYNSGEFQEDNVFSEDNFSDNPNVYHNPKHERKTTNKSYQLKWLHTFPDKNSLSVNYYQQEHDDRNDFTGIWERIPGFDPAYPGSINVDTPASIYSKRKNLEFSHQINGDNFNVVWGGIYRTDETVSPLYLYNVANNKVTTKEYYINTTFNINNDNILNLGYLYDSNDIAGKTKSSRVSYNHHLDENHTFRASYATSTRTPFIFEERTSYYLEDIDTYLQSLGADPFHFGLIAVDYKNLEAEDIESYDIGLLANYNNTSLDIRLFRNKLSNLTYVDEYNIDYGLYDVDYAFFDNGEGFYIKGYELSLHQKFDGAWFKANYAHNKIYKPTVVVNDIDYYENASPFHVFSLLTGFELGSSTTMNLNYYYTGETLQVISERMQDSQGRIDLRLAKSFKIGKYDANASMMVFNLTDQEYLVEFRDTHYTPNGLSRTGYISFNMEF